MTSETHRWWKNRREQVLRPEKANLFLETFKMKFWSNSLAPTPMNLRWSSSYDYQHTLCTCIHPTKRRSCWGCELRSWSCVVSCCASTCCPLSFAAAWLDVNEALLWLVGHLTMQESCRILPVMPHELAMHCAWWYLRWEASRSWCSLR